MSRKINCIIVSGFLGSGKTTFVNQLLQQIDSKKNTAIAINDFGKVNLDVSLINFSEKRIISLNKGCICCSLAARFISDFDKLYNEQPLVDTLLIEASGITSLKSLTQMLAADYLKERLNIASVISIVNSENYIKLLKKLTIIKEQVAYSDIIVLNFKDTTPVSLFKETKDAISNLNTKATILETSFSKIPINLLSF